MRIFETLNNDYIANLIDHASYRVIYAAPGIDCKTANSIINFLSRSSYDNVDVIVDSSPEICRLGYGSLEALELLYSAELIIRKAVGVRIGVIIVDDNAFVYAPTPLLIEEEPANNSPNAIAIEPEQADRLIQSICPKKYFEKKSNSPEQLSLFDYDINNGSAEIGVSSISKKELDNIKNDLKLCPPQKFDLARHVRVYHSYVQFVELKLIGCNIERHTVTIPPKLLNLTKNSEDRERLKATYRLLGEKSKITGKIIEEKVNNIRKKYVRSLGPRFGNVVLRQKKDDMLADIKNIRKELEKFREYAKQKLKEEFERCKKELLKVLLPGVIKNPPEDLAGAILTNKPTSSQAKQYLEDVLGSIIPDASTFVGEMKLQCDFKDITYEMLKDNEFHDALMKVYSYIDWPKAYEEFEAVKEADDK